MSSIQFRTPGSPIKSGDVTEFEQRFGISLPEDYRQFLLLTNGGYQPTPETFKIEEEGETFLKELFSLNGKTFTSLEKQTVQMKSDLPAGVIPIGMDGLGNTICLQVSGKDRGQICFWNHEQEIPSPGESARLLFVARSFQQFLDSLYPDPYKPKLDEIEWIGKLGKTRDLLDFLAKGNDIEATNKYGRTILKEATRYGNIELIELAIAHGAITTGAIHLAAMNRQMNAIDFLLNHGADINERNAEGKTPLSVVWDTEFANALKTKGATK